MLSVLFGRGQFAGAVHSGLVLGLVAGLAVPFVGFALSAEAQAGCTAYVTNAGESYGSPDGTVSPVDVVTRTAGTPILVGRSAKGVAVTPDGSTVCVANFDDGTVSPIGVATNTAGAPIAVGYFPWDVVFRVCVNGSSTPTTTGSGMVV